MDQRRLAVLDGAFPKRRLPTLRRPQPMERGEGASRITEANRGNLHGLTRSGGKARLLPLFHAELREHILFQRLKRRYRPALELAEGFRQQCASRRQLHQQQR